MALSQSEMLAATQSEVTVSNKIRALARRGASRREIADFLGRSYQHVRQVLVEDERRSKSVSSTNAGVARYGQAQSPDGEPDRVFRLVIEPDGRITLPDAVKRKLCLGPGSLVIGRWRNGEFALIDGLGAMRQAQALVTSHIKGGVSLADELIAERRAEAARDAEG